jgi:serine/threonine-protein kinase
VPPPETAAPEPPPEVVVEDKRVKVVLIPDDASAEVEGKPATIKDGLLELVGPPGKVFKVRVFKGISEVDAEVVVTEAGALPPKLELTIGKKIKLTRQSTAAPGTSADESASGGKVGPAPVPTGIKDDTSEFD